MGIKRIKPEYIRKYDYLRSFYTPRDEWFIPPNVLSEYIKKWSVDVNDDEEPEDEEHKNNEHEPADPYSITKELKECGYNMQETEETDPKVIEGNIIDEKAKKFIFNKFNTTGDFTFVDFSNKFFSNKEDAFNETKKHLSSKNIVLFQPTFLHNKTITRPDALVIDNNGKKILIEVKATSNPKIHHILDLYFQYNVIKPTIEVDDCKLCIIKYELQNKNNISFVLVDRAAFTKGGFKPNAEMKRKIDALTPFDSNMIELKSSYRESNAQNYAFNNNNFNLINLLKNGASCLLSGKVPKKTKSVLLLVEEMNEIAFNKRIKDLKDFPIDDNLPKFKPCYEYKSPIKNNDYYSSIREHWYHTKYYIGTQFSGNLIPYKEGLTINEKEFETVDEVINYEKVIRSAEEEINRFDVFERYFSFPDTVYKKVKINNEIICSYNEQGVNEFLSKNLEGFKKVYFDFESINIAIRPADNFLPYMQAVNQVSMCYNDSTENNIKNVKSGESIVIDVINGLDKNDFKKIIDHILPPCDKSILEDKLKCWSEYKYIVYNDGFEKTRLKEMKDYINEEEYNQKVDVINNNMVDLADLFTIKSNESEKGFIAFKELMGFYSIKKVLPLVMKYDRDTFDSVDCKDYHDLKIGNGGKAQSVSTRRFFKMIKNWDSEEKDLIIYCNNDVRAMVAVEYFVYDILNEKIK